MKTNKKILVILGPTATGKTDVALELAKKFNGELVSCDSRQVYKDLDIGTGKSPGGGNVDVKKHNGFWEINGVKIWIYDVVDVSKQYTVADYVRDARNIIEDILSRGKLPIIVGGTGFYLKALLEGLDNLAVPADQNLRDELGKLNLDQLQEKLKSLSPAKYESLNDSDHQNSRRLIRAIELADQSKKVKASLADSSNWIPAVTGITECDVLKVGLTAPREVLYQRVDQRVISRIEQGMIQEAEKLYEYGMSLVRMRSLGLEYGVLADLLEGRILKEDFVRILSNKIHGYVRRQQTWFKKDPKIKWFNIAEKDYINKVEMAVGSWYDQS